MKMALLLVLLATIDQQEKLTEHTLKADSSKKAAKAELSEFSFLQGAWAGRGFGAKCDETWSFPAGDCMLGTFRMVKDDKLVFTEFCMLQKDKDGGVVLRLKHFNPNFDGWETTDKFISFPLVKVDKRSAYFEGLTYAVQSDGSLKIWVAMKNKDGSYKEESLHLNKVDVKVE